MANPQDIVYIELSSSLNISFRHSLSTGFTREEWDDMSGKEQDDAVSELIFNYIDWHVPE